ncbi:Uncharacterised protein [Vibrio cholerae]|uniref:Uncharacterized protein n=1 Tax=Vibrio cholerae TaxID=666 RepID=A0A655X6U4_VIBCL|nr:Uncharacterised protein [Vibrio cholerae]CSI95003.1 Uncharacterised protein [Vibrio cholerae]
MVIIKRLCTRAKIQQRLNLALCTYLDDVPMTIPLNVVVLLVCVDKRRRRRFML